MYCRNSYIQIEIITLQGAEYIYMRALPTAYQGCNIRNLVYPDVPNGDKINSPGDIWSSTVVKRYGTITISLVYVQMAFVQLLNIIVNS